jgi:large subunit ribosomal protein L35
MLTLASRRPFCHRPRFVEPPGSFRAAVAVLLLARQYPNDGRKTATGAEMPKLKTHSGSKKRFKITANGAIKYAQAGKRHGMIKRTTKQIRNLRGTNVLFKTDGDNIIKYRLPNG